MEERKGKQKNNMKGRLLHLAQSEGEHSFLNRVLREAESARTMTGEKGLAQYYETCVAGLGTVSRMELFVAALRHSEQW